MAQVNNLVDIKVGSGRGHRGCLPTARVCMHAHVRLRGREEIIYPWSPHQPGLVVLRHGAGLCAPWSSISSDVALRPLMITTGGRNAPARGKSSNSNIVFFVSYYC
jgi:hypothetical protein